MTKTKHKLYQLTLVISVVQLHQQVKLLWRTVEGLQVAGRCGWTRWWWEAEEERWPSAPSFELQEKAPCCPGEWMAAAGRAVTWPKTPGPEQQDDYARNSFHQDERSRKSGRQCIVWEKVTLDPNDAVFLIVQLCIKKKKTIALSLQSSVLKFIVIVHSYWQSHQLYCWNIRNRNTSFVHTNVANLVSLLLDSSTLMRWPLNSVWNLERNIFLKSQGFTRHCVFLSNKVKLPHTRHLNQSSDDDLWSQCCKRCTITLTRL